MVLETVCMMAGAGLAVAYGMAHAGEPASWAGSALKTGSVLALAAGGLATGVPGLIVAGLFLGAAGDFCLSRPGDRWFLAGMAAFGAGHLAYVLALWHGLPGWVALAAVVALALSTEAPVLYSRPSIDVLFESAAECWGERVVGILLSGGNEDGAQGLDCIARAGGLTIVQDPAEAEVPRMPAAALEMCARIDHVLPVARIGRLLHDLVPIS